METTSRYHPLVIISYLILLGIVLIVGLSNKLKPTTRETEPQTQTPERHEPQLHVTVNPDLYPLKRTG